jgi:hypothetical protein
VPQMPIRWMCLFSAIDQKLYRKARGETDTVLSIVET